MDIEVKTVDIGSGTCLNTRILQTTVRIYSSLMLSATCDASVDMLLLHVLTTGQNAASSSNSGSYSSSNGSSNKQVNLFSKVTRGMLQINNLQLPFIFDSGSECSLIRQSNCDFLKGGKFHEIQLIDTNKTVQMPIFDIVSKMVQE